LLFGCVSVAQYTRPLLEPPPIPPAPVRLNQLHEFRAHQLVPILAMRPFLPNVPLSDYDKILDGAIGATEVVLGETWYADEGGELERAVFAAYPAEFDIQDIRTAPMPFDSNSSTWKLYDIAAVEDYVRAVCSKKGLAFFMRSAPALDWLRDRHRRA